MNFRKILDIETKLLLFIGYVGSLMYLLIIEQGWLSVLLTHILFVCIFSVVYFGRDFLYILFVPVIALCMPIYNWRLRRYLRNFKQDKAQEVAIILTHSNWLKLGAWIMPNHTLSEIKRIVECLEAKKQKFSFYPDASVKDVERIMSNKKIKEVYLVGHGNSHVFQLSTDEAVYYCDFNDPKYRKDFVHQLHCGSPYGKSLIDYVVPQENRDKCFFARKKINSFYIEKELKRKIKTLSK